MKSRLFTGEDALDIDDQIWRWRAGNPEIRVLNQYPDERLPPKFNLRDWDDVLVTNDRVMRQVDYEVIVC